MKKIFALCLIGTLLQGCVKVNPIPEFYYGNWVAETPQFLSSTNRIHTLRLYSDSKGRPRGEYNSTGQYTLFNESEEGFVSIEDNYLTIRKKTFTIEQLPTLNNDGKIEMQLSSLVFVKIE